MRFSSSCSVMRCSRSMSIMRKLYAINGLPATQLAPSSTATSDESFGDEIIDKGPDGVYEFRPANFPAEFEDIKRQFPTPERRAEKPQLKESEQSAARLPPLEQQRTAKIAVIGLANSGKSCLVNRLVKGKVSAVSSIPLTTRHRTVGQFTQSPNQLVLLDTPGVLAVEGNKSNFTGSYRRVAASLPWEAARDADLNLLVVDCWHHQGLNDKSKNDQNMRISSDMQEILKKLRATRKPAILVLNKVDCLSDKRRLLDISDMYNDSYKGFQQTFMISARKNDGVEDLRSHLLAETKPAAWLFEPNQISCISDCRSVHEILREKFCRLASKDKFPYFALYKMKCEVRGWTVMPDQAQRIDVSIQLKRKYLDKIMSEAADTPAQLHPIEICRIQAARELSQKYGSNTYLFLKLLAD